MSLIESLTVFACVLVACDCIKAVAAEIYGNDD
jgi:hypothetical protein